MNDKSGLYMIGFRAGEEVAKREIAKAMDQGIGIGLMVGVAIGIVVAILLGPVVMELLS